MSRFIRIFIICLFKSFFIPITELRNKQGGCLNLAVCPIIPDFTLASFSILRSEMFTSDIRFLPELLLRLLAAL